MKKTILLVCTVITVLLTFNGCKKGDTGPQGPAGTNGTDGNANVTTKIFTNVTWIVGSNPTAASVTLIVPSLIQDIVDHGTVIVSQSSDGQNWYELPRTLSNSVSLNGTYSIYYYLNAVEIDFYATSNITTPPTWAYVKVSTVAGN